MTVYVLTIIDAMKIIVMLTISCLVGMSVGLLFCKILKKKYGDDFYEWYKWNW